MQQFNNETMKQFNNENSFTIIELLVALTVFVFVIISALSVYTITIQRHFQAQKTQVVNEELAYAIELMATDIKNSYIILKSPDNNAIYLAHKTKSQNYENCKNGIAADCLVYKLENYQITSKSKGDTVFVPLTSDRIIIERLVFQVNAEPNSEQDNPQVTILIKARERNDIPGGPTEIFLQTTISQRELEGKPENKYRGAFQQ